MRKRNVDPLSDPDYTLIVRAQDLGGLSETSLSGSTRVQIIVLENLWVNPGPVMVMEHMPGEYPRVIAKVSLSHTHVSALPGRRLSVTRPLLSEPG